MKKRLLSIVMCLAFAAAPVQAWAGETEAETFSFDQVADLVFDYSSGAGGWGEELFIEKDGSFTINYHDSEMGESGDDYPDGTVYESFCHGQLSVDSKNGVNSWILKVDSLEMDNKDGEERIEDGIRYVTTEPAGLKEGDTLDLFCPGYPVKALPEGYLFWAHLNVYDPQPEELPFYGIYNAGQESGYVSNERFALETESEQPAETEAMMGMANPWTETDQDGFAKTMKVKLNVPDGAKDVTYFIMNDGELGEMQFILNGVYCTVRCKAGKTWEDISGLHYDDTWKTEEKCTVNGCEGVIRSITEESESLSNCMWLDQKAGVMYSVTAKAEDLKGFDIKGVAETVYAG